MSSLTDFYLAAERQLPRTWVTGTSYPVGFDVWSPVSGLLYRRIVAGAGSTDPSSDGTNWKLIGPRGIKQIQRGVLNVSGSAPTGTATLSPAVVVANTELRMLGSSIGATASNEDIPVRITLTDTTTITATKVSALAAVVSWEITEYWA